MNDRQLSNAIDAIEAGDPKTGRELLLSLVQVEPDNEEAWLWLESVSDSSKKRAMCLEEVLRINPGNREARRGLVSLQAAPIAQPGSLTVSVADTPSLKEAKGEIQLAPGTASSPNAPASEPVCWVESFTIAGQPAAEENSEITASIEAVLDRAEPAREDGKQNPEPATLATKLGLKTHPHRWEQPFIDEEELVRRFPEYVDAAIEIAADTPSDLTQAISSLKFARDKHSEQEAQLVNSSIFLAPATQSAAVIAEALEKANRHHEAFWVSNIFAEMSKLLSARNRKKYQELFQQLVLTSLCAITRLFASREASGKTDLESEIGQLKRHLENIARHALGTYFNLRTAKFSRDWQVDHTQAERLINESLARHFDRRLQGLVQDNRPRVREYVTANLPLIYRLKLDQSWESVINGWEALLAGTGYDDLIHYMKSTGLLIRADKVGQISPERLDDVRRAAANNDYTRIRELLRASAGDLKVYLYAEAQAFLDYRQPPQPRLVDRSATEIFIKAKRLAEKGDSEKSREALALVQGLWENDIGNLELRDWVAYLQAKADNPRAAEPILEQIRRRREKRENFFTTWNLAVLSYDRKDEQAAYELLVPLLEDAQADETLILVVMALSLKLDDRVRFLSLIPRTLSLRFHTLGFVVAHDADEKVREGELITQLLRQSKGWELPAVEQRFDNLDSFNLAVNRAIVEGQVDLLIPWLEARLHQQRGWIPNYVTLARVYEEEKQDADAAFRILSSRFNQAKAKGERSRIEEACRELLDLCRRSKRRDLGLQAYALAESAGAGDALLGAFSIYKPVTGEHPGTEKTGDKLSTDDFKGSQLPQPPPRDPRLAERLAWVTARLSSIRNVSSYVQEAQAVSEVRAIMLEMNPQESGTVVKLIDDASGVVDMFHRTEEDDHDSRKVLYDRVVGYEKRLAELAASGALPRSLGDVLTPYHVALKKIMGDLSRQAGVGPNIEIETLNSFLSVEADKSTLVLRLVNASERLASDVAVELLLDRSPFSVVGKRERVVASVEPRAGCLLTFPLERNRAVNLTEEHEVHLGLSLRASAEGFPNIDLGISKRVIPIRSLGDVVGMAEVPKLFQAATPLRPTEPALFQGRSDIIRKISGSFYGGVQRERFFLDGIRRVGKTSILNFLPLSLPGTVFPVAVNLDKFGLTGSASSASIMAQFCLLIAESGRSLGIEVDPPSLREFEANTAAAFSSFVSGLKAASPGRVPFVMVDEFQELLKAVARTGRERDTLVLDQIRGHSDEGSIYMVFTGSVRFDRLANIIDHRIFGSLTRLRVSFLEEESVGEVLRAGLSEWVLLPAETIRHVFELTGGYPWLVQTYGAGLVDIVNRERRTVVTPDDVDQVTHETVLCSDELFSHWWPTEQLGVDEERFVEWIFRKHGGSTGLLTRDVFSSIHPRDLAAYRRAFDNLRACEVLDSRQTEMLRFSGSVLRMWLEQKVQDGQLKVRRPREAEKDRGQTGIFIDHENLVKTLERISRSRNVDWRADRLAWFSGVIKSLLQEVERRFGVLTYRIAVAFWERPQEAMLVPAYFKYDFKLAAPEPVKQQNAVDFKVASEVRRANEQALREGTRLSRAIVVTGDGDLSHEARALVNDGVSVQIWGGSRETSESYRDIVGEEGILALDDICGL